MWTAAELGAATGGATRTLFDATGVSIDTRTLQPGDLFVALHGENGDGHDYVAAALAKGAAGAMVDRDLPGRTLLVHDTLQALWSLGTYARARFQGKLVAVTGSVGKTTTKEMLRTILSAHGKTHAAPASYNNHWGVPLTLARLPADADYCVVEIGTNHPGEIGPLSQLARPHVAVITAVAAAHIGFFGSLEAIAAEKSAIGDGLEPGGIAVIPADSPMIAHITPRADRIDTFGAAQVLALQPSGEGTEVEAQIEGRIVRFRIGAPGGHMVANALAALTAANALGIDGSGSIGAFQPMSGRGLRREIAGGLRLLDESYNANGASMRAALAILRDMPGRRVAVLGDMLELGEWSRPEHEALTAPVSEAADVVYACGPSMRHMFDALPAEKRGAHAPDSASLAPVVKEAVAPGDAVLVKGSLGSRMAVVVRALEGAA